MSKKRPETKPKYPPGVTWKDVMKGKPVLKGERRRPKGAMPKRVPHRCRDCRLEVVQTRRAGNVRCVACGGLVDPVITTPLRGLSMGERNAVGDAVAAVEQLGDELDAARAFALALAERVHAAHEVLARRAERRGWDGAEATYCVLNGDKP